MSKQQFVADLVPGDSVNSQFVVRNKRLIDFRNKPGQFLALKLGDRGGEIEAKVWEDAAAHNERIQEGDVLQVIGACDEFRGAIQLNITRLRPCTLSEYDVCDFMPSSRFPVDELQARLLGDIETIQNPYLRELLDSFFGDADFLQSFCETPAARSFHHPFIGGMGEHITSVLELCETVCKVHPEVDRDLLMTGAILHDIGKLRELEYGAAVNYTDAGRLLGHIVLGYEMVQTKIDAIPNFPCELRMRVLHMIISHHGELEFGSPKRPKTIEAIALNLVENMDAKIEMMVEIKQSYPEERPWSDYERSLERYVYLGRPESNDNGLASAAEEPDLTGDATSNGGLFPDLK